MAVLIAVAVSDPSLGLPAAARVRARVHGRVRRLSLVAYFGGEAKDVRLEAARHRADRRSRSLAPAAASAETSTRRTSSSSRTGCRSTSAPLDLSINRAVVYLLLGAALSSCSGSCTMRWRLADVAGHAPDVRRGDLRHRADAGRRDGAADEGDRALVPVRRDADALHLRRQPARLHPAAADRPDLPRRPGVGDLRGDLVDLGDARARRS